MSSPQLSSAHFASLRIASLRSDRIRSNPNSRNARTNLTNTKRAQTKPDRIESNRTQPEPELEQPTEQPEMLPRILEAPSDKEALLGDSSHLSCVIESEAPQNLRLQWIRDETLLTTSYNSISQAFKNRYSLTTTETDLATGSGSANHIHTASTTNPNVRLTNFTLHIKDVKYVDNAQFRCILMSSSDGRMEKSAKLSVIKAPSELSIVAYASDEPSAQSADSSLQVSFTTTLRLCKSPNVCLCVCILISAPR